MRWALGLGLGVSLAAAAAIMAAPAPPKRPAALQALVDCRKIADDAPRLACYDAAVAGMTKAEEAGDLVAVDREQRRQVRRQAFGFTLPSLAIFDRGEKSDTLDRVEETLADAWHASDGRWEFRMQDGAVWKQIDDNDLPRRPHAGSAVVIKRAALGSFMLNVDGQRALRVHRES